MALIHCPECNKEISDKVKACPFCGYPFESQDEPQKDVQQVEIASVNITPKDPKKTKKTVIGITVAVVVLILGFGIFSIIKSNNEKNEFNAYIDTLNLAKETMLDGGSEAESLLNLTGLVWYNTIFEKRDPQTDKYTRSDARIGFNADFNTSLAALMSDSPTIAAISRIDDNQSSVTAMMKELQNPPVGLEYCYETVLELYSAYKGLTDLAINPSGSLQTFTENKSQRIDKFLELFQKLETQIPEKK